MGEGIRLRRRTSVGDVTFADIVKKMTVIKGYGRGQTTTDVASLTFNDDLVSALAGKTAYVMGAYNGALSFAKFYDGDCFTLETLASVAQTPSLNYHVSYSIYSSTRINVGYANKFSASSIVNKPYNVAAWAFTVDGIDEEKVDQCLSNLVCLTNAGKNSSSFATFSMARPNEECYVFGSFGYSYSYGYFSVENFDGSNLTLLASYNNATVRTAPCIYDDGSKFWISSNGTSALSTNGGSIIALKDGIVE